MQPPNVVLIVLDSLRKDHLGCYGYDRNTSPNIDRLAKEGIKANHCYAPSTASLFSHSSIFSGKPVSEHKTTGERDSFDENNKIVSLLREKGYYTIGISNNPFVSRNYGFGKNYDEFKLRLGNEIFQNNKVEKILDEIKDREWESLSKKYIFALKKSFTSPKAILGLLGYKLERSYGYGLTDSGGKKTLEELYRRSNKSDKPFFMFTNLMETHVHYLPPIKFGRKYSSWRISSKNGLTGGKIEAEEVNEEKIQKIENFYDDSIRYVDFIVGNFVSKMEEKHENTVFIITADHGELFFDNNIDFESPTHGHSPSLSDNLLNVPFIIYGAEEFDLETDKAFSLTSLPKIIECITKGKKFESNGVAVSEYFHQNKEEFGRMVTDGKNKIAIKNSKSEEKGDVEHLKAYIKENLPSIENVKERIREEEEINSIDF